MSNAEVSYFIIQYSMFDINSPPVEAYQIHTNLLLQHIV